MATFSERKEEYLRDKKSHGDIRSPHTERSYRAKLDWLQDVVSNRDPRTVGRKDVKTALARWDYSNTQRHAHAVYSSFFDWAMEEGYRKDNPARLVKRPRRSDVSVYRMTRMEVLALLEASRAEQRDEWVIHLGVCAGLRSAEIRGLRGRHFARDGWIHVGRELAKGGKERWVPVMSDLEDVVDEIRHHVAPDDFVVPGWDWLVPPHNTRKGYDGQRMLSHAALYKQVVRVAEQAGISGKVTPHTLRHAFGDHLSRYVDPQAVQALMGHASVQTTFDHYVSEQTHDELTRKVHGFTYRRALATPTER